MIDILLDVDIDNLVHEDDTNATEESSNREMHGTARVLKSDASSSSLVPENGQFNLETSFLNVPSDQMRTIQNIHTLISEVEFIPLSVVFPFQTFLSGLNLLLSIFFQ